MPNPDPLHGATIASAWASASPEGPFHVERPFEQAVFEVPGGPGAEHGRVERGGLKVGAQHPKLGGLFGAVEARDGGEQVVERPARVGDREAVAAGRRARPRRRPAPGRSASVLREVTSTSSG